MYNNNIIILLHKLAEKHNTHIFITQQVNMYVCMYVRCIKTYVICE